MGRPKKKAKLLDAIDSDSDTSAPAAQPTAADSTGFKINEDFAKRFEHNKKREEKARLEEKYGSGNVNGKRGRNGAADDDDESEESTDESEDDDAELVDLDVDREIHETLQALRSKDPRIYDPESKFYRDWEEGAGEQAEGKVKKEKPMFLQDYHRRNLLAGHAGGEEEAGDEDEVPPTYDQEQEALKRTLVGSMHASAAKGEQDGESDDDDDGFMLAESKPIPDVIQPTVSGKASSKRRRVPEVDPTT
ncbi:Kinetochore protein Spc24, partial [Teratosphaeriaceae sp. CCFEE 6253]